MSHTSISSRGQAAGRPTTVAALNACRERISRLTTDIQKIQAKINGYADEASGLKGSLNDATAPEERELKVCAYI